MKHNSLGIFMSATLVALTSCGSEQESIVGKMGVSLQGQEAVLDVEFSERIALDLEATIPVSKYGSIGMYPANDTRGFLLQARVNLGAFTDQDLFKGVTNTLPSGSPFPSYISTSLARVRVSNSPTFAADIYLGTQPEKLYLGVGLELKFVSGWMPEGLTLTQNIKDKSGKVLGVVSMYGPKNSASPAIPGGIFVASNISQFKATAQNFSSQNITVQKIEDMKSSGELIITGPRAPEYQNDNYKIWTLYQTFVKEAEKAGIVRKGTSSQIPTPAPTAVPTAPEKGTAAYCSTFKDFSGCFYQWDNGCKWVRPQNQCVPR